MESISYKSRRIPCDCYRPVLELARTAPLIPTVVVLRTSVALAAETRRTLAGLGLVAGQHVVSVCQHNTSLIKKYKLYLAPQVAESLSFSLRPLTHKFIYNN